MSSSGLELEDLGGGLGFDGDFGLATALQGEVRSEEKRGEELALGS